jgi:hypothetical protein
MAVVQISKIQIRKGRANEGAGIPQLAGGEFAWAVDTQELYIGNGSIAEGAPFVGNTKVLTAADDILSLGKLYQYKKGTVLTGPNESSPVIRSLQDRLDDLVSINAFITDSDRTSGDFSGAFNRALDELYFKSLGSSTISRRAVLEIPPGVYDLASTVFVPSFASIVGAGKGRTVINYSGTGSAFRLISDLGRNDLSLPTSNQQCRGVLLKGFTLNVTGSNVTGIDMDSVRESVFEDIEIDTSSVFNPQQLQSNSRAINLRSRSEVIGCRDNKFTKVKLSNFVYGVYSDQYVKRNHFDDCVFYRLFKGISIGPAYDNIVSNSLFEEITEEGIRINNGSGNASFSNRFIEVGFGASASQTPQISFVSPGNSSFQDIFDRTQLSTNTNFAIDYASEIQGSLDYTNTQIRTLPIIGNQNEINLFRIPVQSPSLVEIDYIYRSKNISQTRFRSGKIRASINGGNMHYSDDYEYFGPSTQELNLIFNLELDSNSLAVKYSNFTLDDDAELTYNYRRLT